MHMITASADGKLLLDNKKLREIPKTEYKTNGEINPNIKKLNIKKLKRLFFSRGRSFFIFSIL